MRKDRVTLLALSAALLLSANANAASPTAFTDFPEGWAAGPLTHAVENGLLHGTADGRINPNGLVTRAQMAAIVTRALGVTERASLKGFTDVDEQAWYYEAMEKAVAMGAFHGDGALLHPNDPINRQEAISVLARVYSLHEGQVEMLADFQDFNMISDWAKPYAAAMVEQGYVLGNGVNMKPRTTITRAELAQILDRMARIYVTDDRPVNIPDRGNVVLRDGDVHLEQMTINGDLIIGDGARRVKLQDVTVTGRILIRGGTDGVSLHKTTADGGLVVDNPSGLTELEVRSSKLGHVTVKSDLRLDSSKLKDLEVHNGAKVTYVQNNTPSSSSSKPDHRPSPKPDSKPDSDVKPQQETLVQEAKIVDLGWSQYMAVRFAQGQSLKNCTLTVDGVDVTDSVTPVSDDGSIVKWEVSQLNHGELVVSDGRHQQRIPLRAGKGSAPMTASAAGAGPDYFLLNGPVYVWEYHLTNYDAAGRVRVTPAKTTFRLGAEENRIPSFSPDAILKQDESALPYGISGEVQLMFNYAKGTPEERAFVDGIQDVALVSADENQTTLNNHLNYELDTEFAHGDHTVACVKVPLGQSNFYSNGRYQLRVTSNGTARLFPIHVVNEKVPSMVLTGASGTDVHFRVKDLNYGVTSPVRRVDLTDPQGVTRTLTRFDDWFLIGDLLVLYNDHTNHFPVDGNYTVTVYADGFQTFHKTFYQNAVSPAGTVSERPVQAIKPMTVDIVTSASVGGGGSSGSGGGSTVMNANLLVDADLMANAKILVSLGLDNAAATGISDRWEDMSKLYVCNKGAEQVYTAESYFDAVNTARTQGKYLSFAEYTASSSAETTKNRPYAVKQILEDNLLGETTSFREAVSEAAPKLTLTRQSGQTAVFSCDDPVYLAKLAKEGTLNLDSTHSVLPAERYTAADGTLTLHQVAPGKHTLKILVPGYQTTELTFEIARELEEVQLTTAADIIRGEPLVITCHAPHQTACDFFAQITAVKLTAPNGQVDDVRPEGQESVFEKIGFTVEGNTLTIGQDVFEQAFAKNEDGTFCEGAYTVELTAREYEQQTLTVRVADHSQPEIPQAKDAPTVSNVELLPGFGQNTYRVTFDAFDGLKPYLEEITSVMLNGREAQRKTSFWQDTNSFKLAVVDGSSSVYDYDCMEFTQDCFGAGEVVVVVTAEGYEPLTFTVVNGTLSGGESKPETTQKKAAPKAAALTHEPASWVAASCVIRFEAPADTEDRDYVYHYLRGLTEVMVNDVVFTPNLSFGSIGDTNYDMMATLGELKFSEKAFGDSSGTYIITLKADGYEDQTLRVVDGALQ